MNQKSVSQIVTSEEAPTKKVKGSSSSPIRLQKQAKEKLDCLLTRANKNRVGRKIKADDLFGYSLDLLTEEHLKDLIVLLIHLGCPGPAPTRLTNLTICPQGVSNYVDGSIRSLRSGIGAKAFA